MPQLVCDVREKSLSCSQPLDPGERLLDGRVRRVRFVAQRVQNEHVQIFEERYGGVRRSEEHTSELQSLAYLVCRLLLEKKKQDASERSSRPAVRQAHRHRLLLAGVTDMSLLIGALIQDA